MLQSAVIGTVFKALHFPLSYPLASRGQEDEFGEGEAIHSDPLAAVKGVTHMPLSGTNTMSCFSAVWYGLYHLLIGLVDT